MFEIGWKNACVLVLGLWVPVEQGPYRISRNPLCFFTGVGLFGVAAPKDFRWLLATHWRTTP